MTVLADQFTDRLTKLWEIPNSESAIIHAETMGATLHKVPGDCVIAEFMDGSFALLGRNGHTVLTTWLEGDVSWS